MPLDSTQFHFAGSGEVFVGPTTADPPTDVSTVLDTDFKGLGYTTEDGVSITPSQDIADIRSWQSRYPTDRRGTNRDFVSTFSLQQLNDVTWTLAFGGGDWTGTAPNFEYAPPGPEFIDVRSFVIDALDGADKTRIYIPRALVTEVGDVVFRNDEPTVLAITLGLMATGTGDPWNAFSNRAEFNPATTFAAQAEEESSFGEAS